MPPPNRITIVQSLLDACGEDAAYLKIGVAKGDCFLNIQARHKIGLDPKLRVPLVKCLLSASRGWMKGHKTRYLKMTSDFFFDNYQRFAGDMKFDVAFIDGLHTYEQSLADALNCLEHLTDCGAVALHDCNPPSAAAAQPAFSLDHAKRCKMPDGQRDWCGDIWKTIVHLRSTRDDLNICVHDCDFGVGIIKRGAPEGRLNFTPADIEKMTYADLEADRQRLLNLKSSV